MFKRKKAQDLPEIDDLLSGVAEELTRKVLNKEDDNEKVTTSLSDVIAITAGLAVGAGICVLLDNRDLKKRIKRIEELNKKEG